MRTLLVFALLLLTACDRGTSVPTPAAKPTPADERYEINSWSLPVTGAAAQPDLIVAPGGALLLSWIAAQPEGGHALAFASFESARWSAPQQIARGKDWFVNWADTPHLAATADGALWAHWLRRTAEAAYAYDVVLTRSSDGGKTWSDTIQVNDDGTPTEHGFVSLWPQARDAIGIAWLDGRNMVGAAHGDETGHGGGGAMTLRTARFDAAMRKSGESELDPRTCDCCQTDAAITARGPLLAYRDRDDGEIRDVVVSRFDQSAWTLPRKVHDDLWKMPACPVNGPALAARDAQAWVAWYTAAGEAPKIRIAHSSDAGDTFAAPRDVDQGEAVQGRVGIAVEEEAVWLSWLREDARGQSLWLARYDAELSAEPQRWRVAKLQGRGRATGFPQLVGSGGVAYLAWTDVVDGKPLLRGARIARRAQSITSPFATPAPAAR